MPQADEWGDLLRPLYMEPTRLALPGWVLGMGPWSVATCPYQPWKVLLTHNEASVATGRVVWALLLAFLEVGW